MDYIDTYMEYVAPLKGSRRYHLWSAISVLSAALERKCYHRIWHYDTFPNLYVCLAGPAGCGKTFTSGAAVWFLKELNREEEKHRGDKKNSGVIFLSDKMSPAAFFKQISESTKNIGTYEYNSVYSYADELSSFIMDIGGGSLADDLVKLYDSPDVFEKEIIKNDKKIRIPNVSVSTLWDTTPDFLQRYLPTEYSREGIGSRVIFVADFSNPRFDRIPAEPNFKLEAGLLNTLYEVYHMSGQMKETPEAFKMLNDIHDSWFDDKENSPTQSSYSQYLSRREKHRIKLCMISAASRGSMSIEVCDVERSERWLKDIEGDMARIFGIKDISNTPDAAMVLFNYIPEEGVREDIMIRRMAANGIIFPQDKKWEGCMGVLKAGRFISETVDSYGVKVYTRIPHGSKKD
jgi:hypothetical protein